ncbi:MAG: hypothetical protein Q8P67_17860, partial [archaeon]|nr:hypothetical protein [archaeon]
ALQEFSIFTMASGVIEHETKIYLYAKDFARDVYALVEMILNTQTRVLKATLKCNDPEWYSGFFLQFQRGLSTL